MLPPKSPAFFALGPSGKPGKLPFSPARGDPAGAGPLRGYTATSSDRASDQKHRQASIQMEGCMHPTFPFCPHKIARRRNLLVPPPSVISSEARNLAAREKISQSLALLRNDKNCRRRLETARAAALNRRFPIPDKPRNADGILRRSVVLVQPLRNSDEPLFSGVGLEMARLILYNAAMAAATGQSRVLLTPSPIACCRAPDVGLIPCRG